MFYCRENELNKLNKRYAGGQFECVSYMEEDGLERQL